MQRYTVKDKNGKDLMEAEKIKQRRQEYTESESESRSVLSNSLQPDGLYSPWNSPGKNTGVGCHFLPPKWEYLSFSPLPFGSFPFTAICKASSDNHFAFFAFLFLGGGFAHCLLYNVTNLCP